MKPLLIALAVIGVLFLVVLFASPSKDADAPADPEGRGKLARTYRPGGLVTGVGAVLGRWSPKVKFTQTAYAVAGEPITVQVPAADDAFRRATIRVAPPHCARVSITYQAAGGEGASLQLDSQKWEGTEDEPCVGSLVVKPKGGTLTIRCLAPLETCHITFE